MSQRRPVFDALTGGRIRYADSPVRDRNDNRIIYAVDRSNPDEYDQETGLRRGVSAQVSVQVGQRDAGGMHAGSAEDESNWPRVTKWTSSAMDRAGTITVPPGTTVDDARAEYEDTYGLEEGCLAMVGNTNARLDRELRAGELLTFKPQTKSRG